MITLRLKVLLPESVLLEEEVSKVRAEAADGHFTLLPRHVDFVSALVPGIFTYIDLEGKERFLALDEGILVKRGGQVFVSAPRAIAGDDLARLRERVEGELRTLNESEKKARTVMSRLEADTLRRFSRLGGEPR